LAVNSQRGTIVLEIVLGLLLILVAAFGVYEAHQLNQADKTAGTNLALTHPRQTASTSQSQPAATTDPYAGWDTYTSRQEPTLSFKYPPSWKASAAESTDPNGDGLLLTSPNGTLVDWNSSVMYLAGCGPDAYDEAVDVQALPAAPGLYLEAVRIGGSDVQTLSYTVIAGPPPSIGVNEGCSLPFRFTSHSDPQRKMSLGTNDQVNSADINTVESILKSLTYPNN
jgi:hypothetical protein